MAPPSKPEPGRDPQMADRARKLNVVFALTSIGMLIAFTVMIWADYDREWKNFQKQFNRLEIKVTKEQAEQALGKVDATRRQELQAEMERAKQEESQRKGDIKKAQSDRDKLEGEWYAVDQDFRFTKAEIDVARYDFEEAAHKNLKSANAKQKHLQDLVARWEELNKRLEDVNARKDAADKQLATLDATRIDAEKKRKELYAEYNQLQDRLSKIQPGFATLIRHMAVLDVANRSLKINHV